MIQNPTQLVFNNPDLLYRLFEEIWIETPDFPMVCRSAFQSVGGSTLHRTASHLKLCHGNRDNALNNAAFDGKYLILKTLIVRLSYSNWDYSVALFYACGNGHVDCVEVLLNAGADINYDFGFRNILSQAASSGQLEMVRFLLQYSKTKSRAPFQQQNLDNALVNGAHIGSVSICKLLLENGASPNYNYAECLTLATRFGSRELVGMLLENGCSTRINCGKALCEAAKLGNLEVLRLILASSELRQESLNAALGWAAGQGQYDAVNLFLSEYPVDHQFISDTILYGSVISNNIQIVNLLIERVSNIRDEIVNRCFKAGACRGLLSMVKLFIMKYDHQNLDYDQALFLSAINNHAHVVTFLLLHGASVDRLEKSVLWFVASQRLEQIATILFNAGLHLTENLKDTLDSLLDSNVQDSDTWQWLQRQYSEWRRGNFAAVASPFEESQKTPLYEICR